MTKILHPILILIFSFVSLQLYASDDKIEKQLSTSQQSNFLYGVGLTSSSQIYKGYSQRTMLIPLIGYKDESLTVFGPYISYNIKTSKQLTLSLKLSPRFQGFDQSDSDVFTGMKKRKNSLDAGAALNYKKGAWRLNLSSMFDILNRSSGYEIKTALSRLYTVGPVFIEPSISVSVLDSQLVDYYYGVSESEATNTRVTYKGKQSQNTAAAISIATPIFLGGYTRFMIKHKWFDSHIANSPLVNGNSTLSVQLFFSKNF
jgi:outer membrane protein